MLYQKIHLNEHFEYLSQNGLDPVLTAYVPDPITEIGLNGPRASVLVISGGGYRNVSQRESEPIALSFASRGYNTFTLEYSVAPHIFPTQLLEAIAAIVYLRRHAKECLIDPNKLISMGFSAGAHLAASLAILGQKAEYPELLGVTPQETKVSAMVLCYPVISSGAYAHADSFTALLGSKKTPETLELVSLEKQVTKNTPPTFLWHTKTDPVVPYQNSVLFAESLKQAGVDYELHLFEKGIHALSLATEVTAVPGRPEYISPDVARWVDLCHDWLTKTLA